MLDTTVPLACWTGGAEPAHSPLRHEPTSPSSPGRWGRRVRPRCFCNGRRTLELLDRVLSRCGGTEAGKEGCAPSPLRTWFRCWLPLTPAIYRRVLWPPSRSGPVLMPVCDGKFCGPGASAPGPLDGPASGRDGHAHRGSGVTDLCRCGFVRNHRTAFAAAARRFAERFGVTVLNSYGRPVGEVVGWTAGDARGTRRSRGRRGEHCPAWTSGGGRA